jgi:hypothetical protein
LRLIYYWWVANDRISMLLVSPKIVLESAA